MGRYRTAPADWDGQINQRSHRYQPESSGRRYGRRTTHDRDDVLLSPFPSVLVQYRLPQPAAGSLGHCDPDVQAAGTATPDSFQQPASHIEKERRLLGYTKVL